MKGNGRLNATVDDVELNTITSNNEIEKQYFYFLHSLLFSKLGRLIVPFSSS